LFLEHGDELRRFLHGVLRDPQLEADVLQAAFTRLVEVGHNTREESRKAWLFRVAYHEAMAVRRRENTGDRVVRRLAWSKDRLGQAADEPLLRIESIEAVREAVAQLPPDQQRVVRMRIYEEKTFAQIAAELQIPLGTALGRMRDALAKLRKKLAAADEET
jgi:RNA polymerase sigma-70 factor (ECF subfamily)